MCDLPFCFEHTEMLSKALYLTVFTKEQLFDKIK